MPVSPNTDLQGPVLGVAWDGAGFGLDETMWGGEFLLCHEAEFTRVGYLRPFRLPGGEICMRNRDGWQWLYYVRFLVNEYLSWIFPLSNL